MRGKRNKFRVAKREDRTDANGVVYSSKAEMQHAAHLDLMVQAGEILSYQRQVPIQLGPDFKTVVDFVVDDGVACRVDEVKGFETPMFKIVKRLWPKYGPCDMHIIKRGKTVKVISGVKS